MKMNPEPHFSHGQAEKIAVVLVNLGTPEAPTPSAVRKYLRQFLSDRRVVEIPKLLWWFILNGVILVTRPRKSAAKYASIWTDEGSPLMVWTQRLVQALQAKWPDQAPAPVLIRFAMRYGQPSVESVLTDLRTMGTEKILILPAYPQYSATTTASVADAVNAWVANTRNLPEIRSIKHYHDHPGYIQSLARQVNAYWHQHGRGDHLVLSFHGLPERNLTLGDPYHCECLKTARLLREQLGIDEAQLSVTFQSRLGRAKWLQPYTEPSLIALGKRGVARVDVFCPGFIADCLETLEEIAQEGRDAFLNAGGQSFHYIPCLNDNPDWADHLIGIALEHCQGWERSGQQTYALADSRKRALALGAKD
jgi:protoporphyrin/coproporphyrin ferrochelatase